MKKSLHNLRLYDVRQEISRGSGSGSIIDVDFGGTASAIIRLSKYFGKSEFLLSEIVEQHAFDKLLIDTRSEG